MKTPPVLNVAELNVTDLAPPPDAPLATAQVDTRFLESLMGYNTRRASVAIIERFMREMAVYDLRPVSFSVMSVVVHNPGITSRQLCTSLGLLPPNLVGMINTLQKRELIERRPHPSDRRAVSLHASTKGYKLMGSAEQTAARLEAEATANLSAGEVKTLMRLLRKIYL